MNTPGRSNAERSDSTRKQLVDAARQLFTERGYAQTSTPEVVRVAAVTRGALYHHFVDKADLFLAAAMQAAQEVAEEIDHACESVTDPFDQLRAGARAYFSAMSAQGRARLLLHEAPTVLQPEQVLALSEATGADGLRQGLAEALNGRAGDDATLAALADLLSAAFDRAALQIMQGRSAELYQEAMDRLIAGLQAWQQAPAG